jgi:hypothetical protein
MKSLTKSRSDFRFADKFLQTLITILTAVCVLVALLIGFHTLPPLSTGEISILLLLVCALILWNARSGFNA